MDIYCVDPECTLYVIFLFSMRKRERETKRERTVGHEGLHVKSTALLSILTTGKGKVSEMNEQ